MRLLLLEDDPLLGEGLRDFLRADHVVEWCTTLAAARALQGEPFDALLVDWQLPDGSGQRWIAQLRAAGDATPALLLTARDALTDRLRGLDGGADDYLVKPFAPEELEARVRAVVRRRSGSASARWRIDPVDSADTTEAPGAERAERTEGAATPVAVDLAARAVQVGSRRADLTGREWALLEALVLRRGRIVSKTELDRLVLGLDAEVASNALEVHVSSLRRKLGRGAIETVRGLGYRVHATAEPRP